MTPAAKGYVDANVILRFVTQDPPDLAQRAKRLLDRVDAGEIELRISPLTVAEVIWVLESYYGYRKEQVAEVVTTFITAEGIEAEELEVVLEALANYRDLNVDFIDAYLAGHARQQPPACIWTLDEKHFRRFKGIEVCTL